MTIRERVYVYKDRLQYSMLRYRGIYGDKYPLSLTQACHKIGISPRTYYDIIETGTCYPKTGHLLYESLGRTIFKPMGKHTLQKYREKLLKSKKIDA